jgi:hypothetical protein
MNTKMVELCSAGDPCSSTVGQRHIFAISRLSSVLKMFSRTDPVSFVSSDYTKGITRVGLIGAKRLIILSERPRSPMAARGALPAQERSDSQEA